MDLSMSHDLEIDYTVYSMSTLFYILWQSAIRTIIDAHQRS